MKSSEELRQWVRNHGLSLGLPAAWLDALPTIEMLPGDNMYEAATSYGGDAFLTWKQQEMLVRLGRLDEINTNLVAEALEDAAMNDGPKWLNDSVHRIMFILSWPTLSYSHFVDLKMAVELMEECLHGCPSAPLFLKLSRRWRKTRYDILALDESLESSLPETCPWASLNDLDAAAKAKIAEGHPYA